MRHTVQSQSNIIRASAGRLLYIPLTLVLMIAFEAAGIHHLVSSRPIDPNNPPGGLFENHRHHAATTATAKAPATASSRPPVVPLESAGKANSLIGPHKDEGGFFAAPLAMLQKPLVTPNEKASFDELFASDIKHAQNSSPAMVAMSQRLASAESIPGLGPRMKRYLTLQAMQLALEGDASKAILQQQMQTLLPQLAKPTLAVASVRASLLTALTQAHSDTASPLLLQLTCSAWSNLAVLQVRSGHWASAGNSAKQARHWFRQLSPKERSTELTDVTQRMAQLVNFAQQAAILRPRLYLSYQTNPAGKAGDKLALYALALLQDPWQAAEFAAHSRTPQLEAMAAAFGNLPGQLQPTSPGNVKKLLTAAQAIAAVVPLADNAAERDALIEYARRKLAELALNKNASKADAAAASQTIQQLSGK